MDSRTLHKRSLLRDPILRHSGWTHQKLRIWLDQQVNAGLLIRTPHGYQLTQQGLAIAHDLGGPMPPSTAPRSYRSNRIMA